jgi:hypothetical protein
MANQILAGAVFQAGQVIAGVDANNPPYVGPPVAKWITRSVTGMPRTLYIRSVMDIDSDPTTLVNTASGFGVDDSAATDPNGRYLAVADTYEGGDGVVFVYDTQDLSAPLATLSPDSGEATYNQNYKFGRSMAMSEDKLFVGNNAQGVPVYCYDLSDLSAAPTKIPTPTTYHNGDFRFSWDMAANSSYLFIGHPSSRDPINSNDNQTEGGAVHVYDVETLQYQTSLFGEGTEYNDHFGYVVDATETHLAVGAYGDDEHGGTQVQTGAAYVFNVSDLTASPTKLAPSTYNKEYARYLSLSDTHLAVAEPKNDENIGSNASHGAVYVYSLGDLSAAPIVQYGQYYGEELGYQVHLFNDGSNRISYYRNFGNSGTGQGQKWLVYNISDMSTPLWESTTESAYLELPAYVAPPPPPTPSFAWQFGDDGSSYATYEGDSLSNSNGDAGWTVEFWMNTDGVNPGDDNLIEFSNGHTITLGGWGGGTEIMFRNGGSGNYNMTWNPKIWDYAGWNHWAIVKTPATTINGNPSSSVDLYLNGVKQGGYGGSLHGADKNYGTTGTHKIGAHFGGMLFDFRISSAARYSADFTPPAAAFISDADTELLTLNKETLTTATPVNITPDSYHAFAPAPANVAGMTAADWTTVGGSSLNFNPGGNSNAEIHWTPGGSRPSTSVAYYEIANMLPGESYELTFEVKLAAYNAPVGVEVHRNSDQSFLMANVMVNGGYQSQTLSWTQPEGLTEAYIHLVSQTNGMGEMRDAVLTKVS